MSEGFDVIGDVHGMGSTLVELLGVLGYSEANGYFAHPTRRAVFVGDLIDRGPQQEYTVRTVKAMVDAGSAFAVMGNHEFNAIAFHTPNPDKPGQFLREHTPKNRDQHAGFLKQVGEGSALHREMVEWFQQLPLWLDLDGLRVVHACWDDASMAALSDEPTLTPAELRAASTPKTDQHEAIEVLLKGPEVQIHPPYLDKDGHRRNKARHAWWRPDAQRLTDAIEVPSGLRSAVDPDVEWNLADPNGPIPARPVQPYPADALPVLFGHYWRSGEPTQPEAPNIACIDFSACKGGNLVAYRWSGEHVLTADNFVSVKAG